MKRLALLALIVLTGCASQNQYQQYQPRFNNYLSLPGISPNNRDVTDKGGYAQRNLAQPLYPNAKYDVIANPELDRRIRYTVPGNTRDVDCGNVETTLFTLNQQIELMQRDANGGIDFAHPERMTDADFQRNHRLHLLAWKLRYVCGK